MINRKKIFYSTNSILKSFIYLFLFKGKCSNDSFQTAIGQSYEHSTIFVFNARVILKVNFPSGITVRVVNYDRRVSIVLVGQLT